MTNLTLHETFALSELAKYQQGSPEWHWWRAFILGIESTKYPDLVTTEWILSLFSKRQK